MNNNCFIAKVIGSGSVRDQEEEESQTEEEKCRRLQISAKLVVSVEKFNLRVVNDDGLGGGRDRRQRDGGSEYTYFIHRRNDGCFSALLTC